MITSAGREISKVLHNDPIMIQDVTKMTEIYKDKLVRLAKKVLKPSLYEDT